MAGTQLEQDLRPPSLVDAIVPLAVLAALIGGSLALFGLDALDGPIQVALILCCAVVALIAMQNGHRFDAVQAAGQGAFASVTSAVFILLAVGALIGVWNLSGTIPTLVYYGIQILSPGWYYAATALICGVVALSIGSSWTTAGTIGVGLVGIAGTDRRLAGDHRRRGHLRRLPRRQDLTALGDDDPDRADGQGRRLPAHQAPGLDLGAGVPRSPSSCSSCSGVDQVRTPVTAAETTSDLDELNQIFNITPLALLPLVLLAYLSIRKVPASLALLAADALRGRARRVPPARRVRRLRQRHAATWSSSRSRRSGRRWPTASRSTPASPTSTGCCRAAAWTACC